MDVSVEKAAVLLLFYGICAVSDLCSRRICVSVFVLGAAAGVVLSLYEQREAGQILAALIPGAAMILCSLLLRGDPGIGDGIFLLDMALFYDLSDNLMLLLSALLFCFAAAVTVFIVKKARKKSARQVRLPFICFYGPFILGGTVPVLLQALNI